VSSGLYEVEDLAIIRDGELYLFHVIIRHTSSQKRIGKSQSSQDFDSHTYDAGMVLRIWRCAAACLDLSKPALERDLLLCARREHVWRVGSRRPACNHRPPAQARVREEITGSHKYENVGESQPDLLTNDPIVSTVVWHR
jgi:hypothetical protein